MEEYSDIRIIHTYKGKKVTQSFFKNNMHLFIEPKARVLLKAMELLDDPAKKGKNPSLFIDEFGKVTHFLPKDKSGI